MPFADIDKRYMDLATAASVLATCQRRKVGAVLVHARTVLGVGQNRAPLGAPHCLDYGCNLVHGHCVRTIHAEVSAILEVGKRTLAAYRNSSWGLCLYVTTSPCWSCANIIAESGVSRVVYLQPYKDPTHAPTENSYRGPLLFLEERGVSVVEFAT